MTKEERMKLLAGDKVRCSSDPVWVAAFIGRDGATTILGQIVEVFDMDECRILVEHPQGYTAPYPYCDRLGWWVNQDALEIIAPTPQEFVSPALTKAVAAGLKPEFNGFCDACGGLRFHRRSCPPGSRLRAKAAT